MKPFLILSHGLESGPDATKVTALAEAAEALGWNEDHSVETDIAALKDYERTGEAIPSEEVFAWLRSLHTDNPLPRPQARKLP